MGVLCGRYGVILPLGIYCVATMQSLVVPLAVMAVGGGIGLTPYTIVRGARWQMTDMLCFTLQSAMAKAVAACTNLWKSLVWKCCWQCPLCAHYVAWLVVLFLSLHLSAIKPWVLSQCCSRSVCLCELSMVVPVLHSTTCTCTQRGLRLSWVHHAVVHPCRDCHLAWSESLDGNLPAEGACV